MNLPEISENLIEQLNHGNTKAFDKIYHTYYLYLCAIAVYYVHDRRVAGEIMGFSHTFDRRSSSSPSSSG